MRPLPLASPGHAGVSTAAALSLAIARVATAMAREVELSAAVSAVLDEAVGTLGAQAAHVYLVERELGGLWLAGARNVPSSVVPSVERIPFDGPLLAARAAVTRRPQWAEEGDLDASLTVARELLRQTGARRLVSLPLLARGELVGVLSCFFAEAAAPVASEQEALGTLAEVFAVGLANALAYERERRLHLRLQAVSRAALAISSEVEPQGMLQAIVEEARRVVDAGVAALGVSAEAGLSCQPWVFSGPEDAVARAVAGHAHLQGPRGPGPSPAEAPGLLCVPIRFRERTLGCLNLVRREGGMAFTAEDREAIELLAAHVGAALEHARLHDAISTERTRLQTLLTHAPTGLLLVDAGTGHTHANPHAERLLGQSIAPGTPPDAAMGRLRSPAGWPLAPAALPLARALRGERVEGVELLLARPDGGTVPVVVRATPVPSPAGRVEAVVASLEDTTLLKELERLREEWTSVVAHDLRQPLNIMSLELGLLHRRLSRQGVGGDTLQGVERTLGSVGTLEKMVADLLDASRLEAHRLALKPQAVDVASLARVLVERFGGLATDRHVRVRVHAEPCTAWADPARVEQVLGNLLSNAAKYGAPGTDIDVDVGLDGDAVLLAVHNRGPGIPPEELPRLFTRFHRTQEAHASEVRGVGLGLYIARGLVEAQGGRIWAESRVGETTTFRFTLPTTPRD